MWLHCPPPSLLQVEAGFCNTVQQQAQNTAARAFGKPTRPRGGNRLSAEAADKNRDASTQSNTVDCTLLASVVGEPQNSGSSPDKSEPVKCSGKPTNEPLENRVCCCCCCCYNCRVGSCCDWLNVRSWNSHIKRFQYAPCDACSENGCWEVIGVSRADTFHPHRRT